MAAECKASLATERYVSPARVRKMSIQAHSLVTLSHRESPLYGCFTLFGARGEYFAAEKVLNLLVGADERPLFIMGDKRKLQGKNNRLAESTGQCLKSLLFALCRRDRSVPEEGFRRCRTVRGHLGEGTLQ